MKKNKQREAAQRVLRHGAAEAISATNSPRRNRAGSSALLRDFYAGSLAALSIGLAALVVYSNSFSVPFLFDDSTSIRNNASIKSLWPLGAAFSPPSGGATVAGRPLLNFTFALNYAIGELDVRGYHALNLLIHILAGLTLFGVVRRTLLRPALQPRFGGAALPLALAIALLWTLHPLQTQSVTYLAQRAESLVGLFYLLTLYCFIRGLEHSPANAADLRDAVSARRSPARVWFVLALCACLLGVLSKEVIVSAPLIVLLYDRTFGAGNFRAALRARKWFYLCLFGTWLPLALLIAGTAGRGGTVGFASQITVWKYLQLQSWGIVQYLRLALWPHPLVFDYGENIILDFSAIVLRAVILLLLVAGALLALKRAPMIGFAGFAFFAILAPSSSFVPVLSEPLAEHRMYLPLAAVLAPIVLGLYARLGRNCLIACAVWAAILAMLTHQRNQLYRDPLTLWQDTVAKMPESWRANDHLAFAYINLNQYEPALPYLKSSLKYNAANHPALNNLGSALSNLNRFAEAIPYLEQALRINPASISAQNNLGRAYLATNRLQEAQTCAEHVLQQDPQNADAYNTLGTIYYNQQHVAEAIVAFETALKSKPDHAGAAGNLSLALALSGKLHESLPYFALAIRTNPRNAEIEFNYGVALAGLNRLDEARAHYIAALRIDPDFAPAKNNLAQLQKFLEQQQAK